MRVLFISKVVRCGSTNPDAVERATFAASSPNSISRGSEAVDGGVQLDPNVFNSDNHSRTDVSIYPNSRDRDSRWGERSERAQVSSAVCEGSRAAENGGLGGAGASVQSHDAGEVLTAGAYHYVGGGGGEWLAPLFCGMAESDSARSNHMEGREPKGATQTSEAARVGQQGVNEMLPPPHSNRGALSASPADGAVPVRGVAEAEPGQGSTGDELQAHRADGPRRAVPASKLRVRGQGSAEDEGAWLASAARDGSGRQATELALLHAGRHDFGDEGGKGAGEADSGAEGGKAESEKGTAGADIIGSGDDGEKPASPFLLFVQ
eukprot:81587-Pleurochrysis_carterae.AAC.2